MPVGMQGHVYQAQQGPRPTLKDFRVNAKTFDGKETYPGLGTDFASWGKNFIRAIARAEMACGYQWAEDVKVEVLGNYLEGPAERYFNAQVDKWWDQGPALWFILERLNDAFKTNVSSAQAIRMLGQRKDPRRSWPEHLLYLVAVAKAGNLSEDMVLESVVLNASHELKTALMAKYDAKRQDYLRHAEELVQFAQLIESTSGRTGSRPMASHVDSREAPQRDSRKCHNCGKVGHIKRNCRAPRQKRTSQETGSQHSRCLFRIMSGMRVPNGSWTPGPADT